jgi:allantoate deiminase
MLFIRCFEGISHNPMENAEEKDIAAALGIAEKFLYALLEKHR